MGRLYSPSVSLGENAVIQDVETNALQEQAHDVVSSNEPFPAGSMPPLPLAISLATNTDNIEVSGASTLSPGTYGALVVDSRAVVTFSTGEYSFTSVSIGSNVMISASGEVDVHISTTLSIGNDTSINASSAADLRFDVAGNDTTMSSVATVGGQTTLRALISAPHGTISFGDHVVATGAFAASDIIAGNEIAFTLQDGFPSTSSGEQGSQQLSGYLGVESDPTIAPVIGPVPSTMPLSLSIGLPLQNTAGLQTFINNVSDPTSPTYRQYLSNDDFVATYGPSDADYQALSTWATNAGLTVYRTYPSKALLTVAGNAGTIENALHTNLIWRQANDGVAGFAAVDREPSVDVGPSILWISGLSNYVVPSPNDCVDMAPSVSGATGIGNTGFTAAELRQAYLGGGACSGLTGAGQEIGIFSYSPFNISDIETYIQNQTTGITPGTVGGPDTTDQVTWSINTPSFQPVTFTSSDLDEPPLDIEMALAIAPAARVHVFEGEGSINAGDLLGGAITVGVPIVNAGNADDLLQDMANAGGLTVATTSWNFQYTQNEEQALEQMAARGISFFDASGDHGNIGDPGNQLHAQYQTIVGGSYLQDAGGLSEVTWNYQCAGASFDSRGLVLADKDLSGGGILNGDILTNQIADPAGAVCGCFPEPFCCADSASLPSYQSMIATQSNGASSSYRNYPDVAANAGNDSFFDQGSWAGGGGTSASAPIWAGFTALANQLAQTNRVGPVGFANPAIYLIASDPALYAQCFHDINDDAPNQYPSAYAYYSVDGYDLVTGWGAPRCPLITQLASYSPAAEQTYPDVLIHVANGHDGVNDGTAIFVDIVDSSLPNGGPIEVVLKNAGDSGWDAIGGAHDLSAFIGDTNVPGGIWPGHRVNPFNVTDVSIRLVGTSDDWDVSGFNVELIDSTNGTAAACLVNLSGDDSCDQQQASCQGTQLSDGNPGIVRLGPDGQASFVDFLTATASNETPSSWGGCPAWQGPVVYPPLPNGTPAQPFDLIHFEFDTADDNMDSGSVLAFDLMGYNSDGTVSDVPIESGFVHNAGDPSFQDQTQYAVDVALNDNSMCPGCAPVDYSQVSGIQLRFTPDTSCGGLCSDEWHVESVNAWGVNSAVAPWEKTCLAEGPPGAEFSSITCIAPCLRYFSFDNNDETMFMPKGQDCE
jgi:kumamolisin